MHRTCIVEQKKGLPEIDDKKFKFKLDQKTITCVKLPHCLNSMENQNSFLHVTEKELRIIDSKEGHLIDYKTVEEGIRSVSLDSTDTIFILTQQHTI